MWSQNSLVYGTPPPTTFLSSFFLLRSRYSEPGQNKRTNRGTTVIESHRTHSIEKLVNIVLLFFTLFFSSTFKRTQFPSSLFYISVSVASENFVSIISNNRKERLGEDLYTWTLAHYDIDNTRYSVRQIHACEWVISQTTFRQQFLLHNMTHNWYRCAKYIESTLRRW